MATKTIIDTIKYELIVNEIRKENKMILEDYSLAIPDTTITNNSIIPTFVKADSDVITMLQKLKEQVGIVVNTMDLFEKKIVETDQDATTTGSNF